ncbi:helix-turn-helix domain-containing protein [Amphritea sp.]|uniref:helix-turn-helix domain-containing protein n=1 Tax=Amphritea sp. TaxID=1872502 RepID=UPI003D0A0CE1
MQQHIISMRLKKAHEDLANTLMKNRKTPEIAYSWGFHYSTHVTRRFRAIYECTPTNDRQQVLEEFQS